MPQVCRVCASPATADVDRALVAGEPLARIARTYGLSRKSVTTHRDGGHVAEVIAKAAEAAELEHGLDLMGDLQLLRDTGMAWLRAANTGELAVPTDKDGRARTDGLVPLVAADTGARIRDDLGRGRYAHPTVAMRAIREVRATLELIARVEGELEPDEQTITVVFDDAWMTGS